MPVDSGVFPQKMEGICCGGTGEPGETYRMKMKYFRFLYGETSACMIHFGEVKDTKMNETFTFLIIRGNEVQREQNAKNDGKKKIPFAIPELTDLVILVNANEAVTMVWNEMQQHVKGRTLIIPDVPEAEQLSFDNVDEVIRLRPAAWKGWSLKEVPESSLWETVTAGWNMQVLCWSEGSLAVWHDAVNHSADDSLEKAMDYSADDLSENSVDGLTEDSSEGLHTGKKEIEDFIDCVMNVKTTENSRCCENRNPDHYGCAMGCVLRRDYDVCRFRYGNRANPYLTGTLLTAGMGEAEQEKGLLKWMSGKSDRIRFLSVQNLKEGTDILDGDEASEPGLRRYVIGLNDEVSDQEAAGLCRKGFGSVPVLLQEGQGVCCSGFLKYLDEQE